MQTLGIRPRTAESGSTVEPDLQMICLRVKVEELVDLEHWFLPWLHSGIPWEGFTTPRAMPQTN